MPPLVLIVEDDPAFARFVAAALRLAGYASTVCHSGAEGLAAAQRDPPAAVVLDMLMPGMSGLTMLEQLRAGEQTASIPVLLLTGSANPERERAALALGAVRCLRKPITAAALIDAVRATAPLT